jgi:hypothetical protein
MRKLIALAILYALPLYGARSFNGTTDKAQAAAGANLDFYGGALISMSTWFFVSSVPGAEADLVGKGNTANGTSTYYISLSRSGHTNHLSFYIHQSTALNHDLFVDCTTTVTANSWHNVVGIGNGSAGGGTGQFFIYEDGVLCGTGTSFNGTIQTQAAGNPDWCFGGYATTGAVPLGVCTTVNYSGFIAETALWNVALTDGEAKSLYFSCPINVRSSGLQGYWPMYGTSGSSFEGDAAGKLQTVTLTGTTGVASHPKCTQRIN